MLFPYYIPALSDVLGDCRDVEREHSRETRIPDINYFNQNKASDFTIQMRGNIFCGVDI